MFNSGLSVNFPIAPNLYKPYRQEPMVNTFSSVPKIAKRTIALKLSKNTRSYNEYAECKIIGGSKKLKNRVAVNLKRGKTIKHIMCHQNHQRKADL